MTAISEWRILRKEREWRYWTRRHNSREINYVRCFSVNDEGVNEFSEQLENEKTENTALYCL